MTTYLNGKKIGEYEDLMVSNELTVDDYIRLGGKGDNDTAIRVTDASVMLGLGSNQHRVLIIGDRSNLEDLDGHNHSARTHPGIFMHGNSTSAPRWFFLGYGGNDATLSSGYGDIQIKPDGDLEIGNGNITLKTADNGILSIIPNGTGYTQIGDAGTASYIDTNDDLYVSGVLEVNGTIEAASQIRVRDKLSFLDNSQVTWGNARYVVQFWNDTDYVLEYREDEYSGCSTRMGFAISEQTSVSGASVTISNLIPAGAWVLGVTTRINTALGDSNGTSSYTVGDGTDADRWGDSGAITEGTTTDNTDATAEATGSFASANDVVLTAVGGNFDGTGDIRVAVHYWDTSPPTK